jgi:hypothetical protein
MGDWEAFEAKGTHSLNAFGIAHERPLMSTQSPEGRYPKRATSES